MLANGTSALLKERRSDRRFLYRIAGEGREEILTPIESLQEAHRAVPKTPRGPK